MISNAWTKSSYSNEGNSCVEFRRLGTEVVGVRDSKDTAAPCIAVPDAAWTAFVRGVKTTG
ncbi:DUF397 domain-containing protein [Streptomyces sp. BI20]|uniref:DUF397 domain-containing protein n=1 Tax=Streptomyces sp. BI20 TaxID=3403460 RepID=UPI003C77041A